MRIRILSTAVLTAAILAACGESGTGPGQSEGITRADAAALARALANTGVGVAQSGAAGASGASRSVSAAGTGTFSFQFDETEQCRPSGSVAVAGTLSGSWNETAQTAQFQADAAVRHQSCALRADDGGTITLTGDPDIDLSVTARAAAAGLTELRITESGAFSWEKGAGNAGRCTVNLTAQLVAGTQNIRVSGDFCGFAIDETGPIGG
jgi:hypothetical protein